MCLQVIVQEYVIDSSGEDVMVELRERSHFLGRVSRISFPCSQENFFLFRLFKYKIKVD
jgi:hypothetical protein